MPVVNISGRLRERLGDEAAEDLAALINRATEDVKQDMLVLTAERYERRLGEESAQINQNVTATRSELGQRITEVQAHLEQRITEVEARLEQRITEVEARLEQRITEVQAHFEQRITEVEARLEQRITQVQAALETQIERSRTDVIRWMFIFWVGQFATLLGVLFVFLG